MWPNLISGHFLSVYHLKRCNIKMNLLNFEHKKDFCLIRDTNIFLETAKKHFDNNEFKLAITHYLKVNITSASDYCNFATCYYRLNLYEEALKLYIKSINIKPLFNTYYNLASTYLKLNDKTSAFKYIRLYLDNRENPQIRQVYNSLLQQGFK